MVLPLRVVKIKLQILSGAVQLKQCPLFLHGGLKLAKRCTLTGAARLRARATASS